MMNLLPLVLLLGGPAATAVTSDTSGPGLPGGGVQAQPCPAAHRNSDLSIRIFLSSPLLPEMRARFDLGTASADDIHLLRTAHDEETCNALWRVMEENGTELSPGDHVSFYRSGDRFFVPIRRHRLTAPGVIQLDGRSSLDIYSSEYQLIGRFAA